jgi:hypothetical protein
MEVEHLFVPLGDRLHLSVWLIADAMIDVEKFGDGHESIQDFMEVMSLVSWQEGPVVVVALHKSVNGVTVSPDTGDNDASIFVGKSLGGANTCGTLGDGLVVDTCSVVDSESNILDTVSMLVVVSGEFGVVRVQRRSEREHDLVVLDNMSAKLSFASLKSLSQKASEIRFSINQNLHAVPKDRWLKKQDRLTW